MSGADIGRRARRVHPNSLGAFATVDLGARQREVLNAIGDLCARGWQPSDADLAEFLNWTINRVTPRRGELVEADLVVQGGDKIAKTRRKVMWWKPSPHQIELFPGIPLS